MVADTHWVLAKRQAHSISQASQEPLRDRYYYYLHLVSEEIEVQETEPSSAQGHSLANKRAHIPTR